MGLGINDPESCPTQINDGTDDSVHYHDVDNAKDTHLVRGKDAGWPGTAGITYALPATGLIDAAPYFCTLAPRTQRL
jgi:hypothetical protein